MTKLRIGSSSLAVLLGAATLAACAGGTSSASRSPAGVAVSPETGASDASPTTQISFLGGPGTQVAAVRVRGSRSGVHTGVLRAYSTGTGESFLPSRPFSNGEQVSVTATISGGPTTGQVRTSFSVEAEAPVSHAQFPNNPGDPRAVQRYATEPSFAPSAVRVTTPAKAGASPGDLFLAPYQGNGTPGPMIVDQSGNLVWFHALPGGEDATNFRVQEYQGKPVLTWWQGRILEVGFGQGEDDIYNASYQHIATVRAGNGYHADLHEIHLTPEGTAWIDTFEPIRRNLTAYHGVAGGVINDSVVQEIDVKTGLVMWEWHALGHVALGESNQPAPNTSHPWDYVHINSVYPGPNGDVLVSSRSTWALYDLDIHTGAVRWRLGGSHSSFRLGAGTRFYWQHDAEFQPGGLISVFDNGSDPPKEKQSRGLLLEANTTTHTVKLVKQFVNPARTLLATSQGNTLALPGGNWLMGYGGLPNFTEYDGSGHVLLDATLGKNVQSFRTYLSPWSGQPASAPALVASPSGSGMSVSVSWNGATDVASWRVLAGASSSTLAPVASAPKSGFQTTIAVAAPGPYAQVQALDAGGNVLAVSPAVKD